MAFPSLQTLDDIRHLPEFRLAVGILASRKGVVRAGPQLRAELPDSLGCRISLLHLDIPVRIVVDLRQRPIDHPDAFLNLMTKFIQMILEQSDLPNRIRPQELTESALKFRQIIPAQLFQKTSVFIQSIRRNGKLIRLLRKIIPELRHVFRQLCQMMIPFLFRYFAVLIDP